MPNVRFLYLSFLSVLLLASASGNAQNSLPLFTPHLDGSIEKGNRQLSASFAGGLSAPQFAQADFDKDGLLDLVIFNSSFGNVKIRTFLNKGVAGAPKYVYAPRFASIFPATLKGFLKLVDYNCDGIPDLFHNAKQGDPGISAVNISKGFYDSNNELKFVFQKNLYSSLTDSTANVYVGNTNDLGVADVDGDGDIDLVSYNETGYKMIYYRNYRVERGLPCDSIQVEREDCWGRAAQGIVRKLVTGLNNNCVPGPPFWNPDSGNADSGNAYSWLSAAKTTAHGYNTVCLLDIDGDGDIDVLNSNAVYSDIQLQVNGRVGSGSNLDSIAAQDTVWQTGGKKVQLSAYPTAYYLDMDADGKKDIVVAPREESSVSKDYNQVWWYRNVGTAGAPQFVFQKDSLLSEDMIDGGSNSHPLFYDFNKDGRPDILMGSTSMEASGIRRNRLAYYQNITTTAGSPKYKFVTDNLVNVSGLSQMGPVPAVGDLDGDGKDDLLIGLENGQMAFYKNTAAFDTVAPVWTLTQTALRNPNNTLVSIDAYAAPFIYDINKDGLPDIVAGSKAGRLTAFINTNITQGIPVFNTRKDSLGGSSVLVDATYLQDRYSTPYIGRIDSTQEIYLLLGSNSGTLKAWKGLNGNSLNATYTEVSADFSGIRVPTRCAPAMGDGDGDGKPELLVGSSWGGLFMYASTVTTGVAAGPAQNAVAGVTVFPNPATTQFTVRREDGGQVPLQLTLRNLMGQVVQTGFLTAGEAQTTLEVALLPAGLYLLTVQGGGAQQAFKIAVVR